MVAPKTVKFPKTSEPSVQNAPGWLSVPPWLKVPATIVMPGVQAGVAEARLPDAIARAHTTRAAAFLTVRPQFQ
jgi:hypothetical protein